jgi:hypothetical protein
VADFLCRGALKVLVLDSILDDITFGVRLIVKDVSERDSWRSRLLLSG